MRQGEEAVFKFKKVGKRAGKKKLNSRKGETGDKKTRREAMMKSKKMRVWDEERKKLGGCSCINDIWKGEEKEGRPAERVIKITKRKKSKSENKVGCESKCE